MILTKKIATLFVQPVLAWYIKKPRSFSYKGFRLIIYPGVFHPGLFFSTKYFYSFINTLNLSNKLVCEIGCGSGLLSLLAASKGGNITALDISPLAVANTKENFNQNLQKLKAHYVVLESDLFSAVSDKKFDVIIINPPYFFKNTDKMDQKAWYCGQNGEYFESLFRQMATYCNSKTNVYMILSDVCEIDRIIHIAQKYNCKFVLIEEKKIYWERNFIYQLSY